MLYDSVFDGRVGYMEKVVLMETVVQNFSKQLWKLTLMGSSEFQ